MDFGFIKTEHTMKGIALSFSLLLQLAMISVSQTVAEPQTTPAQLSDPCNNFTVLNDTWRSTNNTSLEEVFCDSGFFSAHRLEFENWHVFVLHGVRVRMPDQCVQPKHCGTSFPIWMNGSHPHPEDGIVSRNVCRSSSQSCCASFGLVPNLSIQVKACPGDYIVYKLVNPGICFVAYCADANFRPTPVTTSSTTASTTAIYTTESTTDDDRCEDIFCNACSKMSLSPLLLLMTLILFLSM